MRKSLYDWCNENNRKNLLSEWHPTKNGNLTPQNTSFGMNVNVWWKCEHGHEWKASINNRHNGNGCPYCSGLNASSDNCLAFLKPNLIKEWDFEKNKKLSPNDVTLGTDKKAWWKCLKGHSYEMKINDKVKGYGCPICSNKRILIGYNDLATTDPNLAKEWHPTKNGELKPTGVFCSSNKYAWWKCENGHEWKANINNRHYRDGCPYCSGFKASSDNCLAFLKPNLIKEWDFEKNKNLSPNDVTLGTDKKAWWKCLKGHSYDMRIYDKAKGSGCPICSNKRILIGYNDLATTDPNLAKEWHPTKNGELKPTGVFCSSNKYAWWKCENGHEWKANINNRHYGNGCPACNTESSTSFPEQAIYFYIKRIFDDTVNRFILNKKVEIDIFIPQFKIGIEYDGKYFHASKVSILREEKKYDALKKQGITLIRVKEDIINISSYKIADFIIECNYTSDYRYLDNMLIKLFDKLSELIRLTIEIDIDIKKDRGLIWEKYLSDKKGRSLEFCYPILAKEWHPTKNGNLKPISIIPGSEKKVWWKCEYGHEWEANINSRVKGSGCPYCYGRVAINGETDLLTTNPNISKEWHQTKNLNLNPVDVKAGTNIKVWWKCNKGHEWQAYINQRTAGTNCPICSNKQVLPGYNDLATTHPELAREWHSTKNKELDPINITAGSSKKIWWQCENGHEYLSLLTNRTKGDGCPYCSGHKVNQENCLETLRPDLAVEWNFNKNGELLPKDVTCGSQLKVWWNCKHGHEWESTIVNRDKGNGCPVCVGKKVLVGYNDLSTTNSKLAKEWNFLKNGLLLPQNITAGSSKRVWWKCKKEHEWEAIVNNRAKKEMGCPYCSGLYAVVGETDLATTNPDISKQWNLNKNDDIKPTDVKAGSGKKVWWLCENCGNEYQKIIRQKVKSPECPICKR